MNASDIDTIIITDLQQVYERELHPGKDEGGQMIEPDYILLDSIKRVLKYYMTPEEYLKWQLNDCDL